MLALRAGTNPQALITTTPRRLSVLRRILAEASTVQTTDTTYANQAHLPKEFLSQIVSLYENTKLGRQEIYAEFLETTDGVWFAGFDPARHVSIDAEYHPAYFVRCAIDAGTSRHTAAVFFQVRSNPSSDRPRVTVFADYHAQDVVSLKNACAIKSLADQLPCRGRIDQVRVDPAATARSSLGPAAYSEYERVFGSRIIARWPQHLVLDGLDTIEGLLDTGNLVIHPRCTHLKEAFRKLLPPAPRRPVDRFPGRWPSGRRHDGRAPRRHSRCTARRQCACALPSAGPCIKGPMRDWARKWRRAGSNRQPPGCKPGALPIELRPPMTGRQCPEARLTEVWNPSQPPQS